MSTVAEQQELWQSSRINNFRSAGGIFDLFLAKHNDF
jgi:hypothetical protein